MTPPEILRTGWRDKDTRALVARAVFAEVALAAGGVWVPRELEKLVRARDKDKRGLKELHTYKNMWAGLHAPTAGTLMQAARVYPNAKITFWAEHPLFYLLRTPRRDVANYMEAAISFSLDAITGPLRASIWMSEISDEAWTDQPLHNLHASRMNDVMDDNTFDELGALQKITIAAALAKYAMARNDSKSFVRASRLTNSYFVEAVATTPNLYIQWRQLQSIFASQLWAAANERIARDLPLPMDYTRQINTFSRYLSLSWPQCA